VNDGGPSACIVNGHVITDCQNGDDFVPSARLNSASSSSIVVTTVAEGCQVITYSAAEARRYAEAFTRAAELHDGNHGGAR
jgi:hypothetical protein